LQYPPNLRIIRVMCSGMVNPELAVHALSKGADGVLVVGCHPGECHYLEGNHKAGARQEAVKIVLETCGIDSNRYRTEWVSSAEAPRFAEVVTRFTQDVKALGPNPLRERRAA
jgi:F420-non-reducing hydrogenase iron-sulfur subunit